MPEGQEPGKQGAGQEPTPATDPNAGGQEPTGEQQPKPEGGGDKQPTGFDQLPAETQAEIKRLRAEAASNRKAAQEAQAKVEEYETANASELEKANKKAEKAEKDAAEAQAKLLRYEVAATKKIPAEAVELLSGSTREELEAQADRILELTKSSGAQPDFDGGARQPAPEQKKPEEAHNEALLEMLGLKQPTT